MNDFLYLQKSRSLQEAINHLIWSNWLWKNLEKNIQRGRSIFLHRIFMFYQSTRLIAQQFAVRPRLLHPLIVNSETCFFGSPYFWTVSNIFNITGLVYEPLKLSVPLSMNIGIIEDVDKNISPSEGMETGNV